MVSICDEPYSYDLMAYSWHYLKGCGEHVTNDLADRSLVHSAPMKHPPEPTGSSPDEEFLEAPPFTTVGLSIPSMSWLNKQLEADDDGPGMRSGKQDSQRKPRDTGDALSHSHSRSDGLSSTASQEADRPTAQ